MRTAFWTFPRG